MSGKCNITTPPAFDHARPSVQQRRCRQRFALLIHHEPNPLHSVLTVGNEVKKAIVAVVHKLLTLAYMLLRERERYQECGAAAKGERQRDRVLLPAAAACAPYHHDFHKRKVEAYNPRWSAGKCYPSTFTCSGSMQPPQLLLVREIPWSPQPDGAASWSYPVTILDSAGLLEIR